MGERKTKQAYKMIRKNCLICKSDNLKEIINLGLHPFADTFIPEKHLSNQDKTYPLICDICLDCGQIQLRCITNPEDRYCGEDYSYTSSNSNFSRTHWENFAKEIIQKTGLKKGSSVVEIGSNDGFLTKQFADYECKVLGVDPSDYMAKLARERGVETFVELFGEKTAEKINKNFGKADLVIANNVFNHSEYPLDFAKAVSSILESNGTFVYELPYWAITIESGKFDQIYHEHVSYLSAKSSAKIMELAGMRIFAIEVVNYHGGSLRVYAKNLKDIQEHCKEVNDIIEKEESRGLFNIQTYKVFMDGLLSQRDCFLNEIKKLKEKGAHIIAVGAPAKGNTFLNFYGLNKSSIDFVTDSSLHKQGKYTPFTRIPIKGDEIFAEYKGKEVYALLLSWNLAEQLRPILFKINPDIKFISPDKPQ